MLQDGSDAVGPDECVGPRKHKTKRLESHETTNAQAKEETEESKSEVRREEADALDDERARLGLIKRIAGKAYADPGDKIHRRTSGVYITQTSRQVQALSATSRYTTRALGLPHESGSDNCLSTEKAAMALFDPNIFLDLSTLYVSFYQTAIFIIRSVYMNDPQAHILLSAWGEMYTQLISDFLRPVLHQLAMMVSAASRRQDAFIPTAPAIDDAMMNEALDALNHRAHIDKFSLSLPTQMRRVMTRLQHPPSPNDPPSEGMDRQLQQEFNQQRHSFLENLEQLFGPTSTPP
jgi:hypothetical protein